MKDSLKKAIKEIDACIEYFSIRGEYHSSTKYSKEWRAGWEYASEQTIQSLKLIKYYIESELE